MLEKALSGSKKYWTWIFILLVFIGIGTVNYLRQFQTGLTITGLSRDVSWGLYIGQFTFLVGVAASGVMLVLPYYLHNFKQFAKITILGEFLAVSAVIMCMLFIFVDMGQPMRVMNILLYPTPNSVMFWDAMVLSGYLALNIIIGWVVLGSDRKGIAPPKWVKPIIYLSIAWAPLIHTVTAFLYAGIPGRHFWLTAIMAARFLASAFSGGPALLIILALIIRKTTKFDPGKEAIQTLGKIVTYFMITNVFFLGLEFFTAFYSNIPGHMHPFKYLFAGLDGHAKLVPLMWTSVILAIASIALLIFPAVRRNESTLAIASAMVFISLWIDKGFGLIIGGFVPNMFEKVTEYWPTMPETLITIGVWAAGFLVLTILYKIAITVREETAGVEIEH
ncbi:MAG: menaquinol oxidoreductase [Nitrospirae bacterium GWF2_44_13]|nr:MAG: menaquinol oxidoreductase [Nitrospirae bacterium GWF2_44_13]OGW34094.1 MAG: menaquinol oxidoreductase [Nitrospirae bacterium GWD2_44_7]OGW65077.1 MAG: menaquinol oxidoreductase [Nitrospirae bacterium RIFOXYA2_FULL_44_9]HBG92329.1 menaquinol oxidoreductase [Nitrospiraceae bacterium]